MKEHTNSRCRIA